MLNLQETHALNSRKSSSNKKPDIAVGDVVIMKSDLSNRMFWKLATGKQLLPGRDGMVKAAKIKVANSERKPLLLRQSIKHLFPIELNLINNQENEKEDSNVVATSETSSDCTTTNPRARRNAAILADIAKRYNNQC